MTVGQEVEFDGVKCRVISKKGSRFSLEEVTHEDLIGEGVFYDAVKESLIDTGKTSHEEIMSYVDLIMKFNSIPINKDKDNINLDFIREYTNNHANPTPTITTNKNNMKKIEITAGYYTVEELENLITEVKNKKDWKEECVGDYVLTGCLGSNNLQSFYSPNEKYGYKTQEKAEAIANKINLMIRMQHFADFHNDGWVADWSSGSMNNSKYGVFIQDSKARLGYFTDINCFAFGIAVKSEEIAELMLEEFKAEIERFY